MLRFNGLRTTAIVRGSSHLGINENAVAGQVGGGRAKASRRSSAKQHVQRYIASLRSLRGLCQQFGWLPGPWRWYSLDRDATKIANRLNWSTRIVRNLMVFRNICGNSSTTRRANPCLSRNCGRYTLHEKRYMSNGMGCLLTVLTGGLFIIPWLLYSVLWLPFRPFRCQACGKGRLL